MPEFNRMLIFSDSLHCLTRSTGLRGCQKALPLQENAIAGKCQARFYCEMSNRAKKNSAKMSKTRKCNRSKFRHSLVLENPKHRKSAERQFVQRDRVIEDAPLSFPPYYFDVGVVPVRSVAAP